MLHTIGTPCWFNLCLDFFWRLQTALPASTRASATRTHQSASKARRRPNRINDHGEQVVGGSPEKHLRRYYSGGIGITNKKTVDDSRKNRTAHKAKRQFRN